MQRTCESLQANTQVNLQAIRKKRSRNKGKAGQVSERGYQDFNSTASNYRFTAVGEGGEKQSVAIDPGWLQCDAYTALTVYQKCAPVFAVVTARANRISSLDYSIIPENKIEDNIAKNLKDIRDIFSETPPDSMFDIGRKIKMLTEARGVLPDLRPDFSNFDSCMIRWRRRIMSVKLDRADEIQDFFMHPSKGMLWNDFAKQYTQDLLVHGRSAIYKEKIKLLNGRDRLNSIHMLPGGSVFPVKGDYVGQFLGYVQITDGMRTPQLFFQDELSLSQYMPNSSLVNGLTPIDALINLAAENLLFSDLMLKKADGSQPPEKLVVFGEPDPAFGSAPDMQSSTNQFLNKDEQRRIENKLNRKKREGAVAILSGYGNPMLVDLSKSDTLPTQMVRQDQINKYVAMAFNASNQEINETGGDGTSGRSTAESQERADNAKGIRPIIVNMEQTFTHEIIPMRYGYGYRMQFSVPMSEREKIELAKIKGDSGLWSKNEIRRDDLSLDPIRDPAFDIPTGAAPQQQMGDALTQIANRM